MTDGRKDAERGALRFHVWESSSTSFQLAGRMCSLSLAD
jgi:hypothetical protein